MRTFDLIIWLKWALSELHLIDNIEHISYLSIVY
jgi:hypothetical protein